MSPGPVRFRNGSETVNFTPPRPCPFTSGLIANIGLEYLSHQYHITTLGLFLLSSSHENDRTISTLDAPFPTLSLTQGLSQCPEACHLADNHFSAISTELVRQLSF